MPERSDHHPDLFQQGLDLFNAGEFFEAHEVWEDAWHEAEGDDRRFFQGLIQCAVLLVHAQRGNPRGVLRVFNTARTKFVGLGPVYHGVPVEQLVREIDAFIEPVRHMPEEYFQPRRGRGLDMPINLAQAPTITLVADR